MTPPPWANPVLTATTAAGASTSKRCDCIRELMNVLGHADNDLCFLLPFLEGTLGAGTAVQDFSSRGLHATNVVAVDNPPIIRGDLLAIRFNGTDELLEIPDNILLTPIAAAIDAPFSVGCAFKSDAAPAAIEALIAKWDDDVVNVVEWRLTLTANAYPAFEVYDNGVPVANKGREDQTAIVADTWYVVITTYDGQGGPTPEAGMSVYRWDGATRNWDGAVDDATIDGGGVYGDMVDTAQVVTIGADYALGVAAEWFDGDLMMPFYTRRELTAADAERAARLMVRIMGL